MMLQSYTTRRLAAALTLSHMHRVVPGGPVQPFSVSTTDGVSISGILLPRGRPDLLIVCHGFASTHRSLGIAWLIEAMAGRWDVLTFDWRGYGCSSGVASLGGDEILDLTAILTYARMQNYERIGIIGDSMGGLITLSTLGTLAQSAPETASGLKLYPDRIATLSAPADYMLTGMPRPQLLRYLAPHTWARPLSQLAGFRLGRLNVPPVLELVRNITIPWLILHGDADQTVFVQNAYLLHEHAPDATLHIYKGLRHGVDAMRTRIPRQVLDELHAHFSAM